MAKIGNVPNEGSQQSATQSIAKIRDTSRNRLQRLGALYSEKDDLSSPIHRTEANFHADSKDETDLDGNMHKPKHRFGKLAALASTINQWEDDTSHHSITAATAVTEVLKVPPPKPELPSRGRMRPEGQLKAQAPQPPKAQETKSPKKPAPKSPKPQAPKSPKNQEKDHKTKQLKWDPKVLNSLEAQGFQRRESSTVKVSYDFKPDNENKIDDNPIKTSDNNKEERRVVGKLDTTKFNVMAASNNLENKCQQMEKKVPAVKTGIVSGRAAVFEAQAQANQQQQKPQKDPTELTLKERMKLFEKNKGEALVPKAAFGMAPPISKILQDSHNKKEDHNKGKPAGEKYKINLLSKENTQIYLIFNTIYVNGLLIFLMF